MFRLFRKKCTMKDNTVYAPLSGKIIPLENVPDPAFSSREIGDGVAIEPSSSILKSPVDGVVKMLFPTGHAIGIMSNRGEEILIHIGIDTVCLEGKGFITHVKQGQCVKLGEELITFDRNVIDEAGYSCMTMVLITNLDNAYSLEFPDTETLKTGGKVIHIYEKAV